MKYSVTVTLKKDVLDPKGQVVENTLKNMGLNSLKSVRQGNYFEIEVEEKNEEVAEEEVTQRCEKLLANLIIEDYKINKL